MFAKIQQTKYQRHYIDFCRSFEDEGELKSVQHILCESPALQRSRVRYLGDYFFEGLGNLQNVSLE